MMLFISHLVLRAGSGFFFIIITIININLQVCAQDSYTHILGPI